jgi:hypothetical protein
MLSDTACKNAHRGDKAKSGKVFKLTDGKGLFLLVKPQSEGWGKYWRFKYRFEGKEKLLAFGTYPEISLDQARQKREEARKQVTADIDTQAKTKKQSKQPRQKAQPIALK